MTDPGQSIPPNLARRDPEVTPGGLTNAAAAGSPHQYGNPQPTAARERGIVAVSILTGFVLLGLAVILFLALTGWIRTPWQAFPAGTSLAGVHLAYGVELGVSILLGIPVAVLVILTGHVAMVVLRRIPPYRPDRTEPGRVAMTLLLAVCLATAYLALAMQVYYWVTYNPNY